MEPRPKKKRHRKEARYLPAVQAHERRKRLWNESFTSANSTAWSWRTNNMELFFIK
jgi:hypothetical protein